MKKIEILDCTLRDGSYVLDFNFSLLDTYLITKVLFESGVNYVEIGHGLGLGASKKKNIKNSLHSDDEYIKISNLAKQKNENKIGCFCFSNNVTNKNFHFAKKSGLDFIRFAYEKNNFIKIKKDIEYCKKVGLEVHLNLIKTYQYSLPDLRSILKKINKLRIDYFYIVDSSGGMTSNELKKYIKFTRKNLRTDIKIGFHGHNNLGMANSNCITAIDNSVTMIDSSMLGMGRGAGNAITESLAAYLQREKYLENINLTKILKFIKNYLIKIFPQNYLVENILMGKSYFHDSEINKLKTLSKKKNISYLNALNELSFRKGIDEKKINLKSLTHNREKKISNSLNSDKFANKNLLTNKNLLDNLYYDITNLKKDLIAKSSKLNSPMILTICRGKKLESKIYEELGLAIGHIVSPSEKFDKKILKKFKEFKIFFDIKIKKKKYLTYSEAEVNIKACEDLLKLREYKFLKFYGKFDNTFKKKLKVCFNSSKSSRGLYIVNQPLKKKIENFDVLVLKKIQINLKKNSKVNFFIPNYGIVIASEIKRILELSRKKNETIKKICLNKNLYVVEKGHLGKENDIVVDNISKPSVIIGQSDGFGGIKNKLTLNNISKMNLLNWIYRCSIN